LIRTSNVSQLASTAVTLHTGAEFGRVSPHDIVNIQKSPVLETPPGPEVVIDGRPYLYFGGTSYLGLAAHPEVIGAACEATRRHGIHTATSRSGFGNNPPTLDAERQAAAFFESEDAFYFVSGYVGNHILIAALKESFDAVFVDELAHYSVGEACRLASVPVIRFRHRDPADLQRCLARHLGPDQRPLLMTDGVFPVSGALAPVPDYLEILSRHSSPVLLLDDAHGVGVLGEHGRGTLEHFGLWGAGVNTVSSAGVALRLCATMSKAIGGFGGVIPGSRGFLEQARKGSHYFDGASAPPSAAAGATAKALELIRSQPELRRHLRENITRMRSGLRERGLPVADSPTANIGLQLGDADNMRRIHSTLKEQGILLPYLANYSSAGAEGSLRVAVFATHTPEMIDRFMDALRAAV
jgi:7-keto-8-aminopelargonate synthetase-like enzyme